ncbi:MAG: hypothetical protein ACK47B_14440 [Armatimonadota bacterium]
MRSFVALILISLPVLLPRPAQAETYRVSGQVLLPSKKPAAGARVWVGWATRDRQQGLAQGKTDAAGKFELLARAAGIEALTLGGSAPGTAPTWLPLKTSAARLDQEIRLPARLSLAPAAAVAGRLLGTNAAPAAGVTVGIRAMRPVPGTGPADAYFPAPPDLIGSLRAESDAAGRFRLDGLPSGWQVRLEVSGGWIPSEGFPVSLTAGDPQPQDALVVVRPGTLAVEAVGADGKPFPRAAFRIRRASASTSTPLGALLASARDRSFGNSRLIETDPKGVVRLQNVVPGRYELAFQGRVFPVEVPAGDTAGPVRLQGSVEPFKGKVLALVRTEGAIPVPDPAKPQPKPTADAKAKKEAPPAEPVPVVNARIEVEIGRPAVAWPPAPETTVRTDATGAFEFPGFPWHAKQVVVRAVKDNLIGEWVGDPSTLKEPLTLTLTPRVLMTVQGRALGGDGAPLPGASVILWYPLRGKREVAGVSVTDAAGRFEVFGVPRGVELHVAVRPALPKPQGNAPVVEPPLLQAGPFPVPADRPGISLGDVKLAPGAGVAEGEPDPRLLAPLLYPPAVPAASELPAVRDLAFEYLQALSAGDLKRVHALTSPLTPTYSPEAEQFLAQHSFYVPPAVRALKKEELHAALAAPRLTYALLFGVDLQQDDLTPLRESLERPEWALVGYRAAEGVNVLLLAHRGADGWKVAGPPRPDTEGISAVPGDQALFGQPYAPAAGDGAVAAAGSYLQAWGRGELPALHALTSPEAPGFAADLGEWSKQWETRPDHGKPPFSGEPPKPELDTRFSRWDVGLLFTYPQIQHQLRGNPPAEPASLSRFPYSALKSGDLAVVRYTVEGKSFLMLLARRKDRWEVVEPALPG